jgi:S-DNA-T family DNA segregation ATPase FtsK/SpoIIIE
VIVIDELADLMLEAQAEIEPAITKLTQLARATGIHMIIATQRPTVNIITGTIKSNVPGRIAFKVAQKNDSRVILDREGADRLVRKGDMLVLAGSNKMVRAQGAWTKDNEIRSVVGWWKKQGAPCYDEALKANLDAAEKSGGGKTGTLPGFEGGDDDGEKELVEQALEVIRAQRRASTSTIQRKLRLGYNRAARIMDLLEEQGFIGPANGTGPREILFPLDDPDDDAGEDGN